jgi:nitroreductase
VPLNDDAVRQIIASGMLAPSGDNMQPWQVRWDGATLAVTIDPTRDRSLYNYRCHASLIALGALIENIVIAARQQQLVTDVQLAADGDLLIAATLRFDRASIEPDPLFPSIAGRCTNRKPYRRTPLTAEVVNAIQASNPTDGLSTLLFIQDAAALRIVAEAASLNDRLLFEVAALHDGLFECIRWTAKDAERTRDGLFVKTLELGVAAPGFKAMRSWTLVRILNLIGASRSTTFYSFRTFMRSSAFAFLQMKSRSREAFVEGGRRMQRIWLTATSLGLSLQPMAGTLYLLQYLGPDGKNVLGASQLTLLEKARSLFSQVLPLDERQSPILLFRLGYGAPPSATSLRRLHS